jgi:HK97 family phage prohead protease
MPARLEEAGLRRDELCRAGFHYVVADATWWRGRQLCLTDDQVDRLEPWPHYVARWMATRPHRERSAMTRTSAYETLAAAVPLTDVDLYAGTVRGLASVFGSTVESLMGKSRIKAGAFQRTLREHPLPFFKFFNQHHTPVGVLTQAREDGVGLRIEAKLSASTQGKDTLIDIKNGTLGALSIGFTSRREHFETDANGESVRMIEDVDLYEVSAVPWGADGMAHVEEAYGRRGRSPAARLAEAEIDRATALTARWPTPTPGPQRSVSECAALLHRAEQQYAHALLQAGASTPSPERELAAYLRQQAALGRSVAGGLVPTSLEERGYLAPLMSRSWLQAQGASQERHRLMYEASAMLFATAYQQGLTIKYGR